MTITTTRPARYRPSAETFTSPTGTFPTSVITPAMVRTLGTYNDRFRITGSSQTINKLTRYGLAEQHGLGIRITQAGLGVLCMYPNPPEEAPPEDIEAVLARSRRSNTIYGWETTEGADAPYKVIVGRGSVELSAMTEASVRALLDGLRRDMITTGRGPYDMGSAIQRWDLSDGRFLDRNTLLHTRHFREHPYTVFLPGGGESGVAEVWLSARTKREALALATMSRVRGQCTNCQSMRPLNVRNWTPDLGVRCPGCGAGFAAEVVLLCRTCTQPIEAFEDLGPAVLRAAWSHTGKSAYCEDVPRRGFDRPRAQPGGSK